MLFLVVGFVFVDGLVLIALSIACGVAAAIVLYAATRESRVATSESGVATSESRVATSESGVATSESPSVDDPERDMDGPPVG